MIRGDSANFRLLLVPFSLHLLRGDSAGLHRLINAILSRINFSVCPHLGPEGEAVVRIFGFAFNFSEQFLHLGPKHTPVFNLPPINQHISDLFNDRFGFLKPRGEHRFVDDGLEFHPDRVGPLLGLEFS